MVRQTTRRVQPSRTNGIMAVQRWRLIVRRSAAAADLSQRDLLESWATTLRDSGLTTTPPTPAVPEPKLVFAAPLPLRTTADRELVDLILPDRLTSADLRSRLSPNLPPGHELIDLADIWIGEPALPGLVVAADYDVTIRAVAPDPWIDAGALDEGIAAMLAADVIPRDRPGKAALNIRPLITAVVRDSPAAGLVLLMRLRLDPALGSGRPDDVVTALSASLGQPIEVVAQNRTRLWLRGERTEDLESPAGAGGRGIGGR